MKIFCGILLCLILPCASHAADGLIPADKTGLNGHTGLGVQTDMLGQTGMRDKTENVSAKKTWNLQEILDKRDVWSDERLTTYLEQVPVVNMLNHARREIRKQKSFSYKVIKKEKMGGAWPKLPDNIFVRYRVAPLALYLKWLPGGRHEGREVLFDETENAEKILAHEGGLLKFLSIHLSLDNIFVKRDSNHRVTDLALLNVLRLLQNNMQSIRSLGGVVRAKSVKVTQCGDIRCARIRVWLSGQPLSYAKVAVVSLELEHLFPVELTMYDNDKRPFEQFRFEKITPLVNAKKYFSRDWKEYAF